MFNQMYSCHKQGSFFWSVQSFWTILNNQAVIDTIKNENSHDKATSTASFDFSTLHAKILHGKVIRILSEYIDFCFKAGDGGINVFNRYGTQWSNRQNQAKYRFMRDL